jgi:signal transduction histidine kinase
LALRIPVSDINNIMLEENPENGLGNSGEVYLVGSDYLMRSNSRFIANSVLQTRVYTMGAKNAFTNNQGSAIIDDYRTIPVLSSYERLAIPNLEWAILAEIDYAEAMIPIVSIRNDILFLSLIICIFLFSLSHFISRTITNPIIRLRDAAQKVGDGNLDVNIKTRSTDEIGELNIAFNNMVAQLNEERKNRMSAMYNGQEMERQRISRELHDGLGQKLVAIKLQLERTTKQGPIEMAETLRDVKDNFNKTIDEVRQISNNLAPNILNESTLDVAIRLLCNSMKRTTNIDIEFSTHGEFLFSDKTLKTYIYRITQEAINNAVKHSGASNINIQLIESRENLILVIEDNGVGFNYNQNYCSPCNGIYNMKERARLIGATLDIETELKQGTTLRLKIPKKQVH